MNYLFIIFFLMSTMEMPSDIVEKRDVLDVDLIALHDSNKIFIHSAFRRDTLYEIDFPSMYEKEGMYYDYQKDGKVLSRIFFSQSFYFFENHLDNHLNVMLYREGDDPNRLEEKIIFKDSLNGYKVTRTGVTEKDSPAGPGVEFKYNTYLIELEQCVVTLSFWHRESIDMDSDLLEKNIMESLKQYEN